MRMWIIEHFKILPTDKRYKELTIDQIEFLFANYLVSPEDINYKRGYKQGISKDQIIETMPKDLMKKMGYSEKDIERIGSEIAMKES